MVTTEKPPTEDLEAKQRAAFESAVHRLTKDLSSEREKTTKLERSEKKYRRRSVVIPIAIAIGTLIIGAEVWYLTRPVVPPESAAPVALNSAQTEAIDSIATMLVIQQTVASHAEEHGSLPASLAEIAEDLPAAFQADVSSGRFQLTEVEGGGFTISVTQYAGPSFQFNSSDGSIELEGADQ